MATLKPIWFQAVVWTKYAYISKIKTARTKVLELTALTIEAHRSYDAALWDEFCGIARGADLTIEELLVGNGYTDVRDFVLFQELPPGDHPFHDGGCTALLVPGECAEGSPIVGQTWDMNQDAMDYLVIVHRRPDDDPEIPL